MTELSKHYIPAGQFAQLARGGSDVECLRSLMAGQRSRRLRLLSEVVESARLAGPAQAARTQAGYDLLARVQDDDGDAVDAVIDYPAVGAWAERTLRLLHDPHLRPGADPGQLSAIAATAALRGRADCSIEVSVAGGSVMLPGLGRVSTGSATDRPASISIAAGRACVAGDDWAVSIPANPELDAPGWLALRRLTARSAVLTFDVQLDDLDDYRMPGCANLAGRIPRADISRWQSALSQAWELLVSQHRPFASEVATIIRVLTPLTPPAGRSVAATSAQTFGTVALSLPPDPSTLAVNLVHETQHAKMSAIMNIGSLTVPDDRLYYVPWRPDPRPLPKVLDGTYAFLSVAAFWRRQRELETGEAASKAQAEYARWRAGVTEAVGTVQASGSLTGAGQMFVSGMESTLRSWAADQIPAQASALAATVADQHRTEWQSQNARSALLDR
jgi:HEXXH motif-containing protein